MCIGLIIITKNSLHTPLTSVRPGGQLQQSGSANPLIQSPFAAKLPSHSIYICIIITLKMCIHLVPTPTSYVVWKWPIVPWLGMPRLYCTVHCCSSFAALIPLSPGQCAFQGLERRLHSQPLGQRSAYNAIIEDPGSPYVHGHISMYNLHTVYIPYFLQVLAQLYFASTIPNKDQQKEQLFCSLYVLDLYLEDGHELRGSRVFSCTHIIFQTWRKTPHEKT